MVREKRLEAANTPQEYERWVFEEKKNFVGKLTRGPAPSSAKRELDEFLEGRRRVDAAMEDIVGELDGDNAAILSSGGTVIRERECYERSVAAFVAGCPHVWANEYASRKIYALSNLCNAGHAAGDIAAAVSRVCGEKDDANGIPTIEIVV